jgi:hypothetical protein
MNFQNTLLETKKKSSGTNCNLPEDAELGSCWVECFISRTCLVAGSKPRPIAFYQPVGCLWDACEKKLKKSFDIFFN